MQKKLDAVIDLAIKNGWKYPWRPDVENCFELIYNHTFASYVWPGWYCVSCEEEVPKEGIDSEGHDCIPLFEHHLKEMVVSKEPINYLKENV